MSPGGLQHSRTLRLAGPWSHRKTITVWAPAYMQGATMVREFNLQGSYLGKSHQPQAAAPQAPALGVQLPASSPGQASYQPPAVQPSQNVAPPPPPPPPSSDK